MADLARLARRFRFGRLADAAGQQGRLTVAARTATRRVTSLGASGVTLATVVGLGLVAAPSASAVDVSHMFINASAPVAPYTSAAGPASGPAPYDCPPLHGSAAAPMIPASSWVSFLASEALTGSPGFQDAVDANIDTAVHTGWDEYVANSNGQAPPGFTSPEQVAGLAKGRFVDVMSSQSFWYSVIQRLGQVATPAGVDPEAFLGWMTYEGNGVQPVCDDPHGTNERLWVSSSALFWQSGSQWAKVNLPASAPAPPPNGIYFPIPNVQGAYVVFTPTDSYLPTLNLYGILRLQPDRAPLVQEHSCDPNEPSTQYLDGQIADTVYQVTTDVASFIPGFPVPSYLPECDTVDATFTRVSGPVLDANDLQVSDDGRYIAGWTYNAGSGTYNSPAIARFELSADGTSYASPVVVGTGLPLDLGFNGSPALSMSDDGSAIAMCNAGPGGISAAGAGPAGTVQYPLLVHIDTGVYGWPSNGGTDFSQCGSLSLDKTGSTLWWRQADGWYSAPTLIPPASPAPTVAVLGPSNAATYDITSAPQPSCAVTDSLNSSATTTAVITGPTGPRSGVGLGAVTATCSWTDVLGRVATAKVNYTLADLTAPTMTTPADVSVIANGGGGGVATYLLPTATDAVDGSDPVSCTPASGSTFPLGMTTVHCFTIDQAGNATRASFTVSVNPGPLSILRVSAPSTVAAGVPIAAAVNGFDQYGNPTGDITNQTTFTLAAQGDTGNITCPATGCAATIAGQYLITGTVAGITGTRNITVTPAPVDHLAVSAGNFIAGGNTTAGATGYDRYGNWTGFDNAAIFSITPVIGSTGSGTGASCTAGICTATRSGQYLITGTDGAATGSKIITVTPAAADNLSLTASNTQAGTVTPVMATAFDKYGNPIGDVTNSSRFSIAPDPAGTGSTSGAACTAAGCSAITAGQYTITGTDGAASGATTITITPSSPTQLTLAAASFTAGGIDPVTASGTDAYGNPVGDVTDATTFSIAPVTGGSGSPTGATCSGLTCTATIAGLYVITGTNGAATGSTNVTVAPGSLAHLTVRANNFTAGGAMVPTAAGADSYGNLLGDITTGTTFSITPVAGGSGSANGASCTLTGCTATAAGSYLIDGTDSAITGSATVTVTAAAAAAVTTATGSAQSATAGQQFSSPLTATVIDTYGNPVAGATVTFTIQAPTATSGSASFAGRSTATAVTGADGVAMSPAVLAGGQPGPITVIGTVPGATTSAAWTLTVTAPGPSHADLAVSITAQRQVPAGGPSSIQISVNNAGPQAATKVATLLVIPAGWTVTNPGGGTMLGRNLILFSTTSLGVKGTQTYAIALIAPKRASLGAFLATAVSVIPDPNMRNNLALTTISVR